MSKCPAEKCLSDINCPDVEEDEDGDFVVVGIALPDGAPLPARLSVGPGEAAVLVPRHAFLDAVQRIKPVRVVTGQQPADRRP